ncbi:hypothetical protein [Oceanobacter mangrovi]|uniref:hypothetical protein n=1 Tax=Oceanobacter mangrovi TaxID=2862510 RepID=UPI001C8E4234|nr:hypothetical protein [Oceanobacter mangrovi]
MPEFDDVVQAATTAAREIKGHMAIQSGVDTITDNLQPGGRASGVVHGGMKIAKGALILSGAGTAASAAMEVADLGMQAYRDAHDMTSQQIDQTLQTHNLAFTANQRNTTSEARRLFRFAKAANPTHLNVNPNVSDDAMRGGHVVVEDAGALDTRFRVREQAGQFGGDRAGPNKPLYNLPSSHYPNPGPGPAAVQSEHQLPSNNQMNFGTALHGTTPGGASWFQMEAHSGVWSSNGGAGRAYKDYALHATDFGRHKATGRQVGPLGTSPIMEANPLTVTANDIGRSRIATAAANAGRARLGLVQNLTPLG